MTLTRNTTQNKIDHVALVVDESWSMEQHADTVVQVVDDTVRHLAERSREIDREVRVSVYFFASTVRCVIFDMDVFRVPSIKGMYRPSGRTALVSATLKSQEDLATTSQIYGDHAFLTYVVTDGQENESGRIALQVLPHRLRELPDNWTVGVLVPDERGVYDAKRFGFPENNITTWDADSAAGVVEVGATIRRTTDAFMKARTEGVRSTRALFSTGVDAVNATTVTENLSPMQPGTYVLAKTGDYRGRIDDFVNRVHPPFKVGDAYYEYTKREEIQPQKRIVIVRRSDGAVYHDPTPAVRGRAGSPKVRRMIGLPEDVSVKMKPDANPEWKIFVQSTASNRVVLPGTEVFVDKSGV